MAVLATVLVASADGASTSPDRSGDLSVPGPYAVSERSERVTSADSGRSIDLRIVHPSVDKSAVDPLGAPYPLIVFNPGFLLSGDGYLSYAVHLASHGFVIALPTYRMTISDADHRRLAGEMRAVIDRAIAASNTIGDPLFEAIDPDAVGVAGHSLGGKIALLAAAGDGRIRAAGLLDPVDGAPARSGNSERYPSMAPERMADLRIPLLLIGSELGRISALFPPCAPEDENYQRYFEAANPPAIEITQLGAGHGQYVDPPHDLLVATVCVAGDVPSDRVRASAAAYLTAFFLDALRDAVYAADWLDRRLAEEVEAGSILVRQKR